MKEVWKYVDGYKGIYKISNEGRVKSLHNNTEIIRKTPINAVGYKSVTLSKKGSIVKTCLVHRLVAEAFIPNLKEKRQVNHIDGNKENNNVNNLEWVTPRENVKHAVINGLMNHVKGEKHYISKLTKKDVLDIRRDYKNGISQAEISKNYPVTTTSIGYIVNNKTWKHI